MRAAGILGLLVHSFGARAQEPVKNLGAKPPAIGSAMQTGKPLAFEASESGLKLWVKGQKDKGYAFVTQSQYPSLFRIASGNINPFVESREGFTFNGKALSGTLKFQQRWE